MEEHGVNFTELPSDLIEGESEWEVEKILGSRHYGRKKILEYLVKWKGYSVAHNSWEPGDNVHAPELLKEFYSEEPMAIRTSLLTSYHHHLCMSTPSVPYRTFGPSMPTSRRLTLSSPPPSKQAKKTPPPPPASSPPTSGPEDSEEPSVFDVLNVFHSCWFLNRDHLIANVLSAQKAEDG